MSNIDDFKKAAKEALDTLTDVSVEAYKVAEEKAKLVARWTRLNTEISLEKSLIRRLRGEIGVIYYEKFKDDPDEKLRKHCQDITAALNRIDARRNELENLKNKGVVTEEDFEEYQSAEENDEGEDKESVEETESKED